jgi:hypothetical protein
MPTRFTSFVFWFYFFCCLASWSFNRRSIFHIQKINVEIGTLTILR